LLTANALAYPRSSGAAFGLGRAYRETRHFAKAREQFETAIRLDPDNKRARDALADMREEKAQRD